MIVKKKRDKQYNLKVNEDELKATKYISKKSDVSLPDTLRKCIMDTYNELIRKKKVDVDDSIYGGKE